MTIYIPKQYQSLKTKLETIVKKTTIQYSLIASNYNPTIDSTVTVTITVTDSNGDALEGIDVTVTASKGNFTQLNGTNITNASSVTGTTNNNGQFTLTYSCTEWGLITFSANNKTTQVNVTGFKQISTYASGFYTLSVDGSKRLAKLRVSISSTNIASGESYLQSGFVSSTYRPNGNMVGFVTRQQNVEVVISNSGGVSIYNPTSNTISNFTGTTTVYWDY